MQDKKNYSFYMPEDFDEKIDYLRKIIPSLHGLSKSQSVYFLISEMTAEKKKEEANKPDSSGQ